MTEPFGVQCQTGSVWQVVAVSHVGARMPRFAFAWEEARELESMLKPGKSVVSEPPMTGGPTKRSV